MRLMDEDPNFREEEEATVQDRCYRTVEECFSSNREEAMEVDEEFDLGQTRESPQEDYYDSPTPDWMNLYGEESLSQEEPEETEAKLRAKKGKAPMMEEEPKKKATKEILLGAFCNPLLYFSHKKEPTQRKWEGKVPPWLRKGADEKLKAAMAEGDEDDDEDEESGGSEEKEESGGSEEDEESEDSDD